MAQRQVNTRAARAKEIMTSGHRDSLMSQMTILEDLTDLEATVTDTYINTLKEDNDPETLTTIEVESTASKNFATTTETYLMIVIFFTLTQFLENKIYTPKRQFFALNL